jgi:hypothetical protein
MRIGEEIKTVTVEPLEDPVPRLVESPRPEAPDAPREPQPVRVPVLT